jgi:hypothetical protein
MRTTTRSKGALQRELLTIAAAIRNIADSLGLARRRIAQPERTARLKRTATARRRWKAAGKRSTR